MNFDLENQNNKNDDDRENTDRWLISYSDFLTLLFTFFCSTLCFICYRPTQS